MRRSASEVIRNLEDRIARLEGKTSNKNANFKIETDWYTGGHRDDVKDMTLSQIIQLIFYKILNEQDRLMYSIEEGNTEPDTEFRVYIQLGGGYARIYCGVDGEDSYQAGCMFCLWCAFVAAGLHQQDYKNASKKLASMLKSKLSRFKPFVMIEKP